MNIVFAADMSFNYMGSFPGRQAAECAMNEPAKILSEADFSIVNLENVLGDREQGEPIIKSGPNLISDNEYIEYVHALKPTIVGMANNHAKDFGEEVMRHTMDMLTQSGYVCIGVGSNIEDAYQPAKLEKDGVRVAIIAVCENEFGIATQECGGTAGYSLGRITKAIYRAHQEGYKPIIYFHGGNECNPFPSPGKVELYRHFVDLGVEAVIAMHTHCPQGYELYNGKPIVYSMGNFFFPAPNRKYKSWFYGYMSKLDISHNSIAMSICPYKFDSCGVTMLSGEERDCFLQYMEQLCEPIGNEKEIQKLFDSWQFIGSYIETLEQFKLEHLSDGHSKDIVALKNLFSCEAHNELVKNTFRMLYESRFEQAKDRVDFIKALQQMRVAHK